MTARLPVTLFRAVAVLAILHAACIFAQAPVDGYKIIAAYPHLTSSYTEGFFYRDGYFYEGTGMTGRSAVLVEDPATGKVLQRHEIAPELFGEGIIDWGPNLLEWTWQTHLGFVYDRFSMRQVKQFTYTGEGWGMTRTAKELITSDGTSTLRFRDPESFKETRHIVVHDGAKQIHQLNELEYIQGEIYANIWYSDKIARISPRDGRVLRWIDLTGILPDEEKPDRDSVLNGIAYDAKQNRLFITGKQWPKVFEIRIVPATTARAGSRAADSKGGALR